MKRRSFFGVLAAAFGAACAPRMVKPQGPTPIRRNGVLVTQILQRNVTGSGVVYGIAAEDLIGGATLRATADGCVAPATMGDRYVGWAVRSAKKGERVEMFLHGIG